MSPLERSDCMLLANNQGTFKLTNGGARVVLPAGVLQTILASGQMIFPENQPPFAAKSRIARNLLTKLLENVPGIVQDGLVVESGEQS